MFDRFVPDRCRLLKMDCEGAEHEILPACNSLGRVDWFSAEFHINRRLEEAGHKLRAAAGLGRFLHPKRKNGGEGHHDGPIVERSAFFGEMFIPAILAFDFRPEKA